MRKIDINCDMGESYGIYSLGNDEQMLQHVTSVNLACGFHAGDPRVMANTIVKALEYNVAIGAHPSYPDSIGFGRRYMEMDKKDIYHMVMYQIAALQGMVTAFGGSMQHVKPHGALYNRAVKDPVVAEAIVQAICKVARQECILFAPANSCLLELGKQHGLPVAVEVFADRRYLQDGTLVPRTEANAVICEPKQATEQALQFLRDENKVADTLCIHGDHENAVAIAHQLKHGILANGIHVEAVGQWKAI
ncbi:hypothetical protein BHU72_09400 [Desulfuribacillus stibiiarsenatis]|uniref:5-oxoprolinase (ATP-hydrolyzing) subunit A n=1 Tax=Desulfuribacillus stibiiarsenatis TaxID=1390249 RepID=A0A1E5L2W7_9FIRM|nr:5-oxoprolinase subunit PxpA [Desulfuribacillus stibiiarsenatis]OEH84424.1 hypothetical protein BHU72_09400 [Desulfuribacillus stibiiarsenatis]